MGSGGFPRLDLPELELGVMGKRKRVSGAIYFQKTNKGWARMVNSNKLKDMSLTAERWINLRMGRAVIPIILVVLLFTLGLGTSEVAGLQDSGC